MSYRIIRQQIVEDLMIKYKSFGSENFSDRLVMLEVHNVTEQELQIRCDNGSIQRADFTVTFLDRSNEAAGYEVEITLWPSDLNNTDRFSLFVTPESTKDDLVEAYERAMKIL